MEPSLFPTVRYLTQRPAMIPSIKVTLPVLFALWCLGALWAFDGNPVMLAYPAMWVGVAVLFYVVTKFGGPAASDAS